MRTRDQYVDGLKKQLDFWNTGVARWEEKAKGAQATVKERYKRELDVLNAQRELARYNLSLIEDASASAWTELRKGADEAWERMREAAGAAGDYFEKIPAKVAPAPGKVRGKPHAKRASPPAMKRRTRAAK
jgi:hypothetical protein